MHKSPKQAFSKTKDFKIRNNNFIFFESHHKFYNCQAKLAIKLLLILLYSYVMLAAC